MDIYSVDGDFLAEVPWGNGFEEAAKLAQGEPGNTVYCAATSDDGEDRWFLCDGYEDWLVMPEAPLVFEYECEDETEEDDLEPELPGWLYRAASAVWLCLLGFVYAGGVLLFLHLPANLGQLQAVCVVAALTWTAFHTMLSTYHELKNLVKGGGM